MNQRQKVAVAISSLEDAVRRDERIKDFFKDPNIIQATASAVVASREYLDEQINRLTWEE